MTEIDKHHTYNKNREEFETIRFIYKSIGTPLCAVMIFLFLNVHYSNYIFESIATITTTVYIIFLFWEYHLPYPEER